jgi:hypothetical protein
VSNFETVDEAWAAAEASESGEVTTEEASPVEGTSEVVETEAPATTDDPVTEPEATPAWYDGKDHEVVRIGDKEVTFEELRNGYLRQADYTRKTQEVADLRRQAEWAQGLQANLRNDPLGTLQAMAEELRLIPSGQEDFDPSELDPIAAANAQRLSEHEAKLQELTIKRIEEEIRQEVRHLKDTYTDFSSDDVLPMVAELGSQGIGLTIEQGYFLLKGQKAVEAERRAIAAKAKADEIASVEAAKRAAAEQSGGGRSAAGVSTDDAARYDSMSLDEIFEEAWGPNS